MKKSKIVLEFAEFHKCKCGRRTDVCCVVCDNWFCIACLAFCVQCEQPVCKQCYANELCCLVRPWGEKTEEHLRNFYENKLVNGEGMGILDSLIDHTSYGSKVPNLNDLRMEVLRRSVLHHVDNFDAEQLPCSSLVAKCFPRISKYLKNEETDQKFATFIELMDWRLLETLLVFSEDREEIYELADEMRSLVEGSDELMKLIGRSFSREGKPLFLFLQRCDILD